MPPRGAIKITLEDVEWTIKQLGGDDYAIAVGLVTRSTLVRWRKFGLPDQYQRESVQRIARRFRDMRQAEAAARRPVEELAREWYWETCLSREERDAIVSSFRSAAEMAGTVTHDPRRITPKRHTAGDTLSPAGRSWGGSVRAK